MKSENVPNIDPLSVPKIRGAVIQIGDDVYQFRKPSRWEFDTWDSKWQIMSYVRNRTDLLVEKGTILRSLSQITSILSHPPKGGIPYGLDMDGLVDALKIRSGAISIEIESLDEKASEKVNFSDRQVSKDLASKCELLSICIEKPPYPPERWLDEDVTLFNTLWKEIEEFVFTYGEVKDPAFADLLIAKLGSLPPDYHLDPAAVADMVTETHRELSDPVKKKSDHAYHVTRVN